MSESLAVELNASQIKILQRGLQYVKRSTMFEPHEPSDKIAEYRNTNIADCDALQVLLNQALSVE